MVVLIWLKIKFCMWGKIGISALYHILGHPNIFQTKKSRVFYGQSTQGSQVHTRGCELVCPLQIHYIQDVRTLLLFLIHLNFVGAKLT